MMKCVKNVLSGDVKRVSDEAASKMTKEGWDYCPKSLWKATCRTKVTKVVKSEQPDDALKVVKPPQPQSKVPMSKYKQKKSRQQ